jgi:hypothetical protein
VPKTLDASPVVRPKLEGSRCDPHACGDVRAGRRSSPLPLRARVLARGTGQASEGSDPGFRVSSPEYRM